MSTVLRVAVPNKGALSESAAEILAEAGYRRRTDPKDLTVVDPVNNVEFFFLRPKDIAIYVGSGQLDFGITGRDLAAESGAPVTERLAMGFGSSTFRYAAPAGRDWTVADLAGCRIATAYPNLVRNDLVAKGIEATVIRLDGAVEISIQLGVADAIADVVGSGRTLRQHNLVAFGAPLCDSEAVLIERAGAAADPARSLVLARGFVHSKMTKGLPAAPFATTPEAVADATAAGLRSGRRTVWAPGILRFVFSALRHVPGPIWRRLPLG